MRLGSQWDYFYYLRNWPGIKLMMGHLPNGFKSAGGTASISAGRA